MITMAEAVESFNENSDESKRHSGLLADSLKELEGENVSKSLLDAGKKYLKLASTQFEELKIVYDHFESQINEICKHYSLIVDEEEKEMKESFEKMKNDEMKKMTLDGDKELSFVCRTSIKNRWVIGEQKVDMSILIVKYMKDDNSLEEDLKLMSYEKSKLLDDLSYLELPIKKDMLNVNIQKWW